MLSMNLEPYEPHQAKQQPNIQQRVLGVGIESPGQLKRPAAGLDRGRGVKRSPIEADVRRNICDTIPNELYNIDDIIVASIMMKAAFRLLSDGGCVLSAAMLADAVEYLDVSIVHHTASGDRQPQSVKAPSA
jgi:hypothetical protein